MPLYIRLHEESHTLILLWKKNISSQITMSEWSVITQNEEKILTSKVCPVSQIHLKEDIEANSSII